MIWTVLRNYEVYGMTSSIEAIYRQEKINHIYLRLQANKKVLKFKEYVHSHVWLFYSYLRNTACSFLPWLTLINPLADDLVKKQKSPTITLANCNVWNGTWNAYSLPDHQRAGLTKTCDKLTVKKSQLFWKLSTFAPFALHFGF